MHKAINYTSNLFKLPDVIIRSSFRAFDNEQILNEKFMSQLKDEWWHGVKHGIALLGHVAPYAFLNNISTMYIASSNCQFDNNIRCASHPSIDNNVRFCGCRVIHDGFELSRQDKIHNIINYCNQENTYFPLHVCWRSQDGNNCCKCEKCFRTIAGIIAENDDPKKYGFFNLRYLSRMKNIVLGEQWSESIIKNHWLHIQKTMIANKQTIKKNRYWSRVKWIINTDFYNLHHPIFSPFYRLKRFCKKILKVFVR